MTPTLDVIMPKLSDSMEAATILRWLKRPGESVSKGVPLVEVETDKATIVYDAEFDGTLEEIVVDDGGTVPLGAVIARASSEVARSRHREAAEPPVPVELDELEFREAIRQALDEELERDEAVVFFGDDAAIAGGAFAVTPGLSAKHGPDRVFVTPVSEPTPAGAALTGRRPVREIRFGDFLALSLDGLADRAAEQRLLTGERPTITFAIRPLVDAIGRIGEIHPQLPVSWLLGIAGLKIVAPSTPADAKGLLKAAIRDDDPVVFLMDRRLYSSKGPFSGGGEIVPLGRAAVVREGEDVTLVSAMKGVHDCLAAAGSLADRGVSAEVIDLRTLRPLDLETVLGSLAKTNRIAIVEEGPRTGGWAGEVLALVAEHGLSDIDDAWRIGIDDTPMPDSPSLEDESLRGSERIAAERIAAEVLARRGREPVGP